MPGPKRTNPIKIEHCKRCNSAKPHYTRATPAGWKKVNPCIDCHKKADKARAAKRKLSPTAQAARREQWRRANKNRSASDA